MEHYRNISAVRWRSFVGERRTNVRSSILPFGELPYSSGFSLLLVRRDSASTTDEADPASNEPEA